MTSALSPFPFFFFSLSLSLSLFALVCVATAYRMAVSGYGRFFMYESGALQWEFVEVDTSACPSTEDQGNEHCAAQLLQSTGGRYEPAVKVIDREWYHVSLAGQKFSEMSYR